MFDTNNFKRSVKEWVRKNPQGNLADLTDFCEELIPPQWYASHRWLVEQTVGWYENLLAHRDRQTVHEEENIS